MVIATSDGQNVGRRVALVIGNSDYRLGPPLANPRTDAAAIAEALSRLDFDPVQLHLDLDKPGHDRALKQFASLSKKAGIAVVYYAGHGMELDGENYLLPVDAELADVSSLAFEATRLSDLMRAVDGADHFRFVILDACRDNPFRRQMQGIEATRSMLSRGLAAPPDFSGNTLVAYAARHGTQAKDGKKGANSPFAAALLKHIETPNTDIRLIIGRIRDDVRGATDSLQEPAFYGSMGGTEIQLKYVANIPISAPATEESAALLKVLEEERDWEKAQRADTIAAYEEFGRFWPSGRFGDDALRKIEDIKEARDFESARKQKGVEALRSFLVLWPEGALRESAQKILNERETELAWETEVKAMTSQPAYGDEFVADVLRNFLAAYPASKYAGEVKKKLADAEKIQEAQLDNVHSTSAYRRYVRNWPNGARHDYAQRLLDGGGDDRLWIEVQEQKSIGILERYISEWPNGRHAADAAKILPKWKRRERLKEWSLIGFGLTILGAIGAGGLSLLFFGVPYVYANLETWITEVREYVADLIRPHKDDPAIMPYRTNGGGLLDRTTPMGGAYKDGLDPLGRTSAKPFALEPSSKLFPASPNSSTLDALGLGNSPPSPKDNQPRQTGLDYLKKNGLWPPPAATWEHNPLTVQPKLPNPFAAPAGTTAQPGNSGGATAAPAGTGDKE